MAADHDVHEHDHQPAPEPEQQLGASPGEGGPVPEDVGSKALAEALRWSFIFLVLALLGAFVVYLCMRVFTVPSGEVRVKLCFGRPVRVPRGGGREGKSYLIDAESGWHIQWPWEEVVRISLAEQSLNLRREFSAMGIPVTKEEMEILERAGEEAMQEGLSVKMDGYLVTGDLNIVHLKLRVRWRVHEDMRALDYALRFQGTRVDEKAAALLRRFVVRAAIEAVGSISADDVMTMKKEELPGMIGRGIEEQLNRFERDNAFSVGVVLAGVQYDGEPSMPAEVRPHYDAAQTARDDKHRMVEEAGNERTEILKRAVNRSTNILREARTYRDRLVATAEADEEMMKKLLEDYKKPGIARILANWHYQRTIIEFLRKARTVTVVPHPTGDARVQYLINLPAPVEAQKEQEMEGPAEQE